MAKPKYYVRTEIHNPAVLTTPVVLGVENEDHTMEMRNLFTK